MVDPLPGGRIARRLTRLAFTDPVRAGELLSSPPLAWWDAGENAPVDDHAAAIIAALSRTADPDQALITLVAIAETTAGKGVREALAAGAPLRARLLPLLGASRALAEHLTRHPVDWEVLESDWDEAGIANRVAASVGLNPDNPVCGTAGQPATVPMEQAVPALRAAYRRELVAIAGRDLAAELDLEQTTAALAALAGGTLQAALSVAAAAVHPAAAPCRLAIIAMGKTGGGELNYVSDVDVVFVAEPGDSEQTAAEVDTEKALATATRLARETMRIAREVAWEVDAALRPEGKDGPLVRTLASHAAYYQRWASTWEFQALLKARPVAGDLALGTAYQRTIAPLVWSAAARPDFVPDVRAMRRRVVEHIPAAVADREIKLGRGGLRDVEFAVQLLQLVHGRADESLRLGGTLPALAALRDGGYVGRDDAVSLDHAYRFLRTTEHRLQLRNLRRTHLVPTDAADREWLARTMGYRPDARGDARAVWEAEWALHAREVRRLHEKLFYRPLLESVARVPAEGLRLTAAEAARRLHALGFADASRALQHIDALTAGLSRRAVLQRTLLPVLLSEFADAPDPDGGLLAYRQLSDQLGSTPWYLRLLRDEGAVATRLAYLLGTSRYVGHMLAGAPEALQMLAADDDLRLRGAEEIAATMAEAAERQRDPAEAVVAIRGVRRQELLRIAFADLLGIVDVDAVVEAISATTDATLQIALGVAERQVADSRRLPALPLRFAIIALGRLGGHETSYGSDADVLFVFEAIPDGNGAVSADAARLAHEVAGGLRSLLSAPSATDPPLGVDAGLRPEGRAGALVRSIESYRQYYARWSSAWEAQALLRARWVAGDRDLGADFVAMIDPVRYPAGGLSTADVVEIRRLKARVDTERLPRGADPHTHAKLGPGGLADVEWTIQLLQLGHGDAIDALRTTRTLDALVAAAEAGLLTVEQTDALAAAWRRATRIRNATMLVRDKPGDQMPTQGIPLIAVGRAMGYPSDLDPGAVVDDYRRTARHARRVVEDVFYGPDLVH